MSRVDSDRGSRQDLFGRGMIYVVVWSMQLVVATAISPVLAHLLPVEEFGALAAAIALYQLLLLLAVFGLDQALEMRRLEDPDAARTRGLLAAGICFAFLIVAAFALSSPLWSSMLGFAGYRDLVLITFGWAAPGAAVMLMMALLQAEDRLAQFAFVSILSSAGGPVIGLAIMLSMGDRSAVTYAWGGVFAQSLALVLGLCWTRPRPAGLRDLPEFRRVLAFGAPLLLAGLSQFVLAAADRLAVLRVLGEAEVARYQIAFTIGNVMSLLLTFTNRAWLPRLKSLSDVAQRWQVIEQARDGIYVLLGWAILGVTLGAPVLLRVLAPPSYQPDSLVVVVFVVACCAIPVASGAASMQLLTTIGDTRPLGWSAVLAVAVKIVVTAALLVPLGILGAAIATLVALTAQAGLLRWIATRRQPATRPNRRVLGFGAAALVVAALSVLLPQSAGWNAGRFAISLALTIPFFMRMRILQRANPAAPDPGEKS
ncbi:lipopolysaccharide biosynthesis protein [Naumannella huperziae]